MSVTFISYDVGSEDVAETIENVETLSLVSLAVPSSQTASSNSIFSFGRRRTGSGSGTGIVSARSITRSIRSSMAKRAMTNNIKQLGSDDSVRTHGPSRRGSGGPAVRRRSSAGAHAIVQGVIEPRDNGRPRSSSNSSTSGTNIDADGVSISEDIQKARMQALMLPVDELMMLLRGGDIPPYGFSTVDCAGSSLTTLDGLVTAIKGCVRGTNIAIVIALLDNMSLFLTNNPQKLSDLQALKGDKETDIRGPHWVVLSLLTVASPFIEESVDVAVQAVPLLCRLLKRASDVAGIFPSNFVDFSVEFISKVLEKHCSANLPLTKDCCIFLLLLCSISCQATVKDAVSSNDNFLIKFILNLCFAAHIDDVKVVALGCDVLCCFAIDSDSRRDCINLGVLEVLYVALDHHLPCNSDNATESTCEDNVNSSNNWSIGAFLVAENVAKVLFSLVYDHPESRELVCDMPVCKALMNTCLGVHALPKSTKSSDEDNLSNFTQDECCDDDNFVDDVNEAGWTSAAGWGLRALGAIAYQSPHNQQVLTKLGCCELVIRMLKARGLQCDGASALVAEGACFAVAQLAQDNSEVQGRLLEAGCGEVLANALQSHRDSLEVIRECSIAWHNLVGENAEAQQLVGRDTNICVIILETFIHTVTLSRLQAQDDEELSKETVFTMQYVWFALSVLSSQQANRERLYAAGVSDCFVVALGLNETWINVWLFKCLVSFTWSVDYTSSELKLDKICVKLPAALNKSAADMMSASEGALCVGIIAGLDPHVRNLLSSNNAFDVIVHILYKYEGNVTVAGCCVFALANLCLSQEANLKKLRSHGGCTMIARVLRLHSCATAIIARWGCQVFAMLAAEPSAVEGAGSDNTITRHRSSSSATVPRGSITEDLPSQHKRSNSISRRPSTFSDSFRDSFDTIVLSFNRHPTNIPVLEAVCRASQAMAFYDKNVKRLQVLGLGEVLLNCLMLCKNGANEVLAEYALGAIYFIVRHDKYTHELDTGYMNMFMIDIVVDVVSHHKANAAVVARGCQVLSYIAIDKPDASTIQNYFRRNSNAELMVKYQLLETTVCETLYDVLLFHVDSTEIISSACSALTSVLEYPLQQRSSSQLAATQSVVLSPAAASTSAEDKSGNVMPDRKTGRSRKRQTVTSLILNDIKDATVEGNEGDSNSSVTLTTPVVLDNTNIIFQLFLRLYKIDIASLLCNILKKHAPGQQGDTIVTFVLKAMHKLITVGAFYTADLSQRKKSATVGPPMLSETKKSRSRQILSIIDNLEGEVEEDAGYQSERSNITEDVDRDGSVSNSERDCDSVDGNVVEDREDISVDVIEVYRSNDIFQALVDLLHIYKNTNDDIIAWALRVLIEMVQSRHSCRVLFAAAGACEAVYFVLVDNIANKDISYLGLFATYCLALNCFDNALRMIALRTTTTIIKIIQFHKASESIAYASCKAVRSLADKHNMIDRNIGLVILSAFQQHLKAEKVCTAAGEALCTSILSHQNVTDDSPFSQVDGDEVDLLAQRVFASEEIASNRYLSALESELSEGERKGMDDEVDFESILCHTEVLSRQVVKALARHTDCRDFCTWGSLALGKIFINSSIFVLLDAESLSKVLVGVLRKHNRLVADDHLIYYVLKTINNVTSDRNSEVSVLREERIAQFRTAGLLPILYSLMNTYSFISEEPNKILHISLDVLSNLIETNDTSRFKMVALGACEFVIEMLHKHQRHEALVVVASRVMKCLATTAASEFYTIQDSDYFLGIAEAGDKPKQPLNIEQLSEGGGCETAIWSLQTFINNKEVAVHVLGAVHCLAIGSLDNRYKVGECGGVAALHECLKLHINDEEVCLLLCLALGSLCKKCDENCVKFGEMGTCQLLLQIYDSFGIRNKALAAAAARSCAFFASFLRDFSTSKHLAPLMALSGGVAKCLSIFPCDELLAFWSIYAINEMFYVSAKPSSKENDGPTHSPTAFASAESLIFLACDCLGLALHHHLETNEKIVLICFLTLSNMLEMLCSNSVTDDQRIANAAKCRDYFIKRDISAQLSIALTRYKNNPIVCYVCLKSLHYLCLREGSSHFESVHKAIVSVMAAHGSDELVLQWGCQAIGSMAMDGKIRDLLVTAGACEVVVGALQRGTRNREALVAVVFQKQIGSELLALGSCMAAGSLCANDEGHQEKLGALGACEAVIKVLQKYDYHELTASAGCQLIVALAKGQSLNAINCTRLNNAGCSKTLLPILEGHRWSQQVALWGCRAIEAMVGDLESNALKVGSGGICGAIVVTMQTHQASAEVAGAGCGAIASLALCPQNTFVLGAEGGCEAVVFAIRLLFMKRDVMIVACRALARLLELETNCVTAVQADAASALHCLLAHYSFPSVDVTGDTSAIETEGGTASLVLIALSCILSLTRASGTCCRDLCELGLCPVVFKIIGAPSSSRELKIEACYVVHQLILHCDDSALLFSEMKNSSKKVGDIFDDAIEALVVKFPYDMEVMDAIILLKQSSVALADFKRKSGTACVIKKNNDEALAKLPLSVVTTNDDVDIVSQKDIDNRLAVMSGNQTPPSTPPPPLPSLSPHTSPATDSNSRSSDSPGSVDGSSTRGNRRASMTSSKCDDNINRPASVTRRASYTVPLHRPPPIPTSKINSNSGDECDGEANS